MSLKSCILYGFMSLSSISYAQKNNSKINIFPGTGAVYWTTQKELENRLFLLAKKSKLEDAWLYYDNKLFDIGEFESENSVNVHISKNFKIDSLATLTFYHIHPQDNLSPPSLIDIVNSPETIELFKNNNVIAKVIDRNGIWEYHLSDSLKKELKHSDYKTFEEKLKYLDSKVNILYDPSNKYLVFGMQPYPYKPTNIKEHINIMKQIGVIIDFTKK